MNAGVAMVLLLAKVRKRFADSESTELEEKDKKEQ